MPLCFVVSFSRRVPSSLSHLSLFSLSNGRPLLSLVLGEARSRSSLSSPSLRRLFAVVVSCSRFRGFYTYRPSHRDCPRWILYRESPFITLLAPAFLRGRKMREGGCVSRFSRSYELSERHLTPAVSRSDWTLASPATPRASLMRYMKVPSVSRGRLLYIYEKELVLFLAELLSRSRLFVTRGELRLKLASVVLEAFEMLLSFAGISP